MRIAALYDVHGNLPALEAVLAEARADAVVCGGDLVSGPFPAECLEALRAVGARFVMGNADREALTDGDWAGAQLSAEQRSAVAAFEPVIELDGVLFCHGSPRSDEEVITQLTPPERLERMLAGVSNGLVVCGHTHHQFELRVRDRLVVNAGSVGLPYQGDAAAFWLLVQDGRHAFMRTSYDVTSALTRLRATGFPDVEELLQDSLVVPLGAMEAAKHFEGVASA